MRYLVVLYTCTIMYSCTVMFTCSIMYRCTEPVYLAARLWGWWRALSYRATASCPGFDDDDDNDDDEDDDDDHVQDGDLGEEDRESWRGYEDPHQ